MIKTEVDNLFQSEVICSLVKVPCHFLLNCIPMTWTHSLVTEVRNQGNRSSEVIDTVLAVVQDIPSSILKKNIILFDVFLLFFAEPDLIIEQRGKLSRSRQGSSPLVERLTNRSVTFTHIYKNAADEGTITMLGVSSRWLSCLCVLAASLAIRPTFAKTNRVILVSFDGFRHDYLELAKSRGKDISAFEAIIKKGFRGQVKPIMPTITFPTHFAIATGRYAENHGIMNNQFYDPQYNATFSYKSPIDAVDTKWWNYNGNEPIWITNERHPGKKSCVIYWPGSSATYGGIAPSKTLGLYNGSVPFDTRIRQIVEWMKNDEEITFCSVYMRQPDAAGHSYGPNSTEVMDKIEEMNGVAGLLTKLIEETPELKGKVNVIITSDHGMGYVDAMHEVEVRKYLKADEVIPNPSVIFLGLWPKPGGWCFICIIEFIKHSSNALFFLH